MSESGRHGKREAVGLDNQNLTQIADSIANSPKQRPVDDWNPPFRGMIDIRILADGTWHHEGSAIRREALVSLFASVLRREKDGQYVLVTPVEKVGITVDDAPFLAVHMDVAGEGAGRVIGFRTNVGDYVKAGAANPIRFVHDDETGGLKPYVEVRGGLEALATRAIAFDLANLAEPRTVDGHDWIGVYSDGVFFQMARADEIDA